MPNINHNVIFIYSRSRVYIHRFINTSSHNHINNIHCIIAMASFAGAGACNNPGPTGHMYQAYQNNNRDSNF